MNPADHPQRIARLTALDAVLEQISQLPAAAARSVPSREAAGWILAEDIVSERMIPQQAIALRDGWAVRADWFNDAGSYSPMPLPLIPKFIDAGIPMPPDTDTVAPLDAVRVTGKFAEAVAPVVPGDGVLLPGTSVAADVALWKRGERFRPIDVAIGAFAGIDSVAVRRPRVAIARSSGGYSPAQVYLQSAVEFAGGEASLIAGGFQGTLALDADAIVLVGGTGTGDNDRAVEALARAGQVYVHGIAISPGETTAFGFFDSKPVLILPGRFDAALGAWLFLGRALISRLAGSGVQEQADSLTLTRKISSAPGVAEAVLVRRDGDSVTPLAASYFPLGALVRADGWVRVPPESEGYPAGAAVDVLPLPDLL